MKENKYRTNQTDWMIKVWDVEAKGFSDFCPVSTWSRSRKAGLAKAKSCLQYNRGANNIPRFKVVLIAHRDISSLMVPIKVDLNPAGNL